MLCFFVVCFLVHDGVIQVLASACITFPWRQWNDFSEKCQHCVVFFSWDSEVILVQNVSTVCVFFQCMMKWYKYNMPVLCAYSIFFLETNYFSTKRQHYVVCFQWMINWYKYNVPVLDCVWFLCVYSGGWGEEERPAGHWVVLARPLKTLHCRSCCVSIIHQFLHDGFFILFMQDPWRHFTVGFAE